MAQYDVYEGGNNTLLLDVQADLLDHLNV